MLKSSTEYNSSFCTIPNLSLKGVVSDPAFVVAPINVNFGKSNLIDLAVGPFPIMISKVQNLLELGIRFLLQLYLTYVSHL